MKTEIINFLKSDEGNEFLYEIFKNNFKLNIKTRTNKMVEDWTDLKVELYFNNSLVTEAEHTLLIKQN